MEKKPKNRTVFGACESAPINEPTWPTRFWLWTCEGSDLGCEIFPPKDARALRIMVQGPSNKEDFLTQIFRFWDLQTTKKRSRLILRAITVENQGFGQDPLKYNDPGGDWHPGGSASQQKKQE